jgi:hypothetical protein
MKLVDIMNMSGSDLNKLTKSELQSVYRTLNKNIKSRVERLKNTGLNNISPAIRYGQETGAIDMSMKPSKMTHKQLRKAITTQRNFINKKTSTVTGTKKYYRLITGKSWSSKQKRRKDGSIVRDIDVDKFFKVYENMKREFASEMASGLLTSEQIMNEIRQVWYQRPAGFDDWKEWDEISYRNLYKKLYGYDPNDVDKIIDDIMGDI